METRPRFLTSLEIAAVCGVSTRTVSNWIREGVLAAHRTAGGHGRVSAEEVRRFLGDRGMAVPPDLAGAGPMRAASPPAPGAEEKPDVRRILVIDDDEAFLEVVREVLAASGFEVEGARHGFLAGYLVGRSRPKAILLDILMPGIDGYEVLSLLRRRPESRGIPVVACTSLRGAEVEARVRSAGFDAYLRKPVEFRVLLDTLARLVP